MPMNITSQKVSKLGSEFRSVEPKACTLSTILPSIHYSCCTCLYAILSKWMKYYTLTLRSYNSLNAI